MDPSAPFVLLDDARASGAADAHLYEDADAIFVARRPEEVSQTLDDARAAQGERGGTLAGYLAYEAGLALEPKLASLAHARTGAAGPLVWLGLFGRETVLPARDVPGWLAERGDGPASLGPLDPQLSQGGFEQAFAALQDAIRAGDIYQANLTLPLAGSYRGDPVALYAALRPAARAGYGGLIYDGTHWLLSLSPELFVSLRDGRARARPMKGTRPRGTTAAEDRALAAELAASEKERAENLMIVDLLRNDLSRVAQAGSVAVEEPFAVETYPTIHTMTTTIDARLAEGKIAIDLLRALFPCGSITGAPKIRAMELIHQVEREPRGAYCGAIGRIGSNGEAAFNVGIRTLRLTPVENGRGTAVLGVGSAIVADSDPRAEWRETILKGGFARASAPDLAAPGFHLIETMRFDAEHGIALLDLHLERMKASAAQLGFAFDRHAARNRIQALCFDLERTSRLRLVCARSGATTLEASPLAEDPGAPLACILLPLPVDPGDWRLRHKTSDRGFYDDARAVAAASGADEALFVTDAGLVTEGAIHNVFAGPDDALTTPPAALGLLPGILRRSLLDAGRAAESEITVDALADGFRLGNAVRGLRPATLLR